jgi:hypothetical protein
VFRPTDKIAAPVGLYVARHVAYVSSIASMRINSCDDYLHKLENPSVQSGRSVDELAQVSRARLPEAATARLIRLGADPAYGRCYPCPRHALW